MILDISIRVELLDDDLKDLHLERPGFLARLRYELSKDFNRLLTETSTGQILFDSDIVKDEQYRVKPAYKIRAVRYKISSVLKNKSIVDFLR
jgi:hypothetical protein